MRNRARTAAHTVVLLAAWAVAGPAVGQVPSLQPIPQPTRPSDVNEVDEIVDDEEILPPGEGDPAEADDRANLARIERLQKKELAFSPAEIRSRHDYGVSLTLGSARPWVTYSVDAVYIVRPDLAVGMFAGSGERTVSGIVDEKSYDSDITARMTGVTSRYWFSRLEGLFLEGTLGYASWDGRMSPHGNDAETPVDAEVLSASFRAHGLVGGVATGITWQWEGGFFLDWTLVGLQKSRVMSADYSRSSGPVESTVRRDLETPSFFGLTNIRVGYLF